MFLINLMARLKNVCHWSTSSALESKRRRKEGYDYYRVERNWTQIRWLNNLTFLLKLTITEIHFFLLTIKVTRCEPQLRNMLIMSTWSFQKTKFVLVEFSFANTANVRLNKGVGPTPNTYPQRLLTYSPFHVAFRLVSNLFGRLEAFLH